MIRHSLQLGRNVIEAMNIAKVARYGSLREDDMKAGVPNLAVLLVDCDVTFDDCGANLGVALT
jgi:hypothetical protein